MVGDARPDGFNLLIEGNEDVPYEKRERGDWRGRRG